MKIFANFGEADPVEFGDVELYDVPGILDVFKSGNVEDGEGVDYYYSEHEFQITPFYAHPVLHIYFHLMEE